MLGTGKGIRHRVFLVVDLVWFIVLALAVFSFGGAVNDLEANSKGAQRSIDKAADNARLYAEEVKRHLMAVMEASQPKQEVAANV